MKNLAGLILRLMVENVKQYIYLLDFSSKIGKHPKIIFRVVGRTGLNETWALYEALNIFY
jgi:hypothetical protein